MLKLATTILLTGMLLLPGPVATPKPTVWYVATTGSDSTGNGSIEDPFQTIQHAIEAASDSDTVVVMEGWYAGPGNASLNFTGKAITVRSRDPEDDAVMRATIIDAEGQGVIVRFVNDEGPGTVFAGFSLVAGDTSRAVQGIPGFFEFSDNAQPTTSRLRIAGAISPPATSQISIAELPTLHEGRRWDGNNPFHQPAATTDYHGSGDVNGDGTLTPGDALLAQEMADGLTAPSPRADVDGNNIVNAADASLIFWSWLTGNALPGWWNSLTERVERDAWVTKIMAIDQTDQHDYVDGWFVCADFATQTFINGAFARVDMQVSYRERYNGGQTVFNVPMYDVGVPGHAINGILVGDDPLNFEDWRFIEPQNDSDVVPGSWNMLFPANVSISIWNGAGSWLSKVRFYVDADPSGGYTWTLQDYNPHLVLTRPTPEPQTPDNRPDLWDPRIVPVGQGMVLFERFRDDMSRTTDIHLASLPFVDPPIATPLVMDSQYSRLLDSFQGPDRIIHLLWQGKPGCNPGIFYGQLDPVTSAINNITRLSSSTHDIGMGRVIATPSGEVHAFWFQNSHSNRGILWNRWTGSDWQGNQNLTLGMAYQAGVPNWVNRDFLRYFFDVTVSNEGQLVLIWAEQVGSNGDAVVRQLRYDGEWGEPLTIIDATNVRGVELLTDHAGVLHLVYWLGDKQGAHFVGSELIEVEEGRGMLLHQTYDGASWSTHFTVDDSGSACCPRMEAGAEDIVYLVWETQSGSQVVPIWNKYADGMWDDAQTLDVRPGADAWYPTVDSLPDGKLVIAWSSRSPDRVTIGTATVAFYGVALEPLVDAKSDDPGETVTYTLQITNTGAVSDTFDVVTSRHTWPTTAPSSVGPLAAGGGASVDVTVDIPPSAAGGATDTASIIVASQGDSSQVATVTLTTTASVVCGVTMGPVTGSRSGDPGVTVTHTLRMTNTGNITDVFDVSTSGNIWSTTVPPPVGALAAGASANVVVTVSIPATAMGGHTDVATITATSQGDDTKSATATLMTTARHTLFLPLIQK
jgi:putative Ca2+/H+ antiporter (TMEM165/GDT1 family)